MSKFGGFFARKAALHDRPDEPAPSNAQAVPAQENPLELDEELFNALGVQIGSDNELLRNLLIDASAKIGELDTIKAAVSRLVDPVGKALRAFETEKSEKAALQTVLNNTRTAYGKLRNEVAELEKKSAFADKELHALRQELSATQTLLRTTEATKSEIAIDLAARRAQIAELEARLAQETSENKSLRDENHRLDERLTNTDKRLIGIEADLNGTRQRLLMTEDEKRALQTAFEKTSAEAARLSRKLAETEAALATSQGRLRHVEANFTEVSNERARIAAALDEANERYEREISNQRMRFETLEARAAATEKLLGEAREHLIARAEEVRDYDRRASEIAMERDALQSRLATSETERIQRESQFQEIDQARATLLERTTSLARAYANKEAALGRAEETIAMLSDRITALEAAGAEDRQTAEKTIEELSAALRREKMERAVAEGALETGRKDFTRLMREVMALQRSQQAAEEAVVPSAANAA
jgi:crescentin